MQKGSLWFVAITPLDQEEIDWLNRFTHRLVDPYEAMPDLTRAEAHKLFLMLWQQNPGTCRTCGAREGRCDNTTCIRTRITNKWFLPNDGVVEPETWVPVEALS